MFADLHIHTDYSDGIHTPESIIKKSLEANFTKIAITDHDIFLGNIDSKLHNVFFPEESPKHYSYYKV